MRAVLFGLLLVMSLASTENDIMVPINDDRVTFQLYFEAQCPFCMRFIQQQLKPVLQLPGIWDIADFRLIPYGNANVVKNGKFYEFTCQHGVSECQGNIIYTCALNLYNQQSIGLPFVVCLDGSSQEWNRDGPICAQQTGADWDRIKSCTNSFYGREWQYENALKTEVKTSGFNVNHVPYLTVNGVFDENNERYTLSNLLKVICSNYKGNLVKTYCQYQNLQGFY